MTWILCQKQLSKGYMTRRGWSYNSIRKPSFTKFISKAIRYETKELAEKGKKEIISEIKSDIQKAEELRLELVKKIALKPHKTAIEFTKDMEKSNFSFYEYHLEDEKLSNKKQLMDNLLKSSNEGLQAYNWELNYFTKEVYIREVPMGFRFMKSEKRKIEFFKNECNNYCTCCGGDLPDTDYLKIGWSAKLCLCCLSELLPEIQKRLDIFPAETKDLWGKERFLTDLG